MSREVDLVSYLPPFLAVFKENVAALEAENPEFRLVWEETDRVLKNEFIATADEYGLGRIEKLLNILPLNEDNLESRRIRALARWNEGLLYTLPQLRAMLEILCGQNNCSADIDKETYELIVKIGLIAKNNFADVQALLERVCPQNLIIQLIQLYNTHAELHRFTHEQLRAYTYEQLRNEVLTNGGKNP